MDWFSYFWSFLKAMLFSSGGMGPLPILYEDLPAHGWATEKQFAEALAVGQVSPGPGGLWVVSLGFLTGGWLGAGFALVAVILPSLLVLFLDTLYRSIGKHPVAQGFIRGLSLASLGIFVVVIMRLLQDNGLDAGAIVIILSTASLVLMRRVPVIVLLALAGIAGVILYH